MDPKVCETKLILHKLLVEGSTREGREQPQQQVSTALFQLSDRDLNSKSERDRERILKIDGERAVCTYIPGVTIIIICSTTDTIAPLDFKSDFTGNKRYPISGHLQLKCTVCREEVGGRERERPEDHRL